MAGLETIARYAETLRHLRRVQFTNRVVRHLRPAGTDLAPPPPVRRKSKEWLPGIDRKVRLNGPAALTLINQPGDFGGAGAWNDSLRPRLWLYNLHYFDWLSSLGVTAQQMGWARDSIVRWLAENPPAQGTGWEPYPLSLRIANWIKWLAGGNDPVPGMIESLAVQLRFLERTLEWHLLGNHLLANAKALFLGGCFFAGGEGERWLAKGERLLLAQWESQILADGGHEERSPMYHAVLLEDALDCLNAARGQGFTGSGVAVEAAPLCARMLAWLTAMTHPDGEIACFNDAATGIAATTAELLDYAAKLQVDGPATCGKLTVLEPSGYVRAEAGAAVLLADIAPVGPDHQPGHAHADTLGFELSLFGDRVLVSAGTSTYETGAQRGWERSTAAHNCVALGEANSSDVWAGFRTGRRARIVERKATVAADGAIRIAGAHDGWRFLPGRPRHRREWLLRPSALTIADRVDPVFEGGALAWLHLAPSWQAQADGRTAAVTGPAGRFTITASAPFAVGETSRSLGFNRTTRGTSLAYPLANGRGECVFAW